MRVSAMDAKGASRHCGEAPAKELGELFWLARRDNVRGLSRILASDPSLVQATDYDCRTALHIACFYGSLDAAKLLIKSGANVNATDRWGNSPLADAQAAGHSTVARLLKDHGGKLLMGHGSLVPPISRNSDWEIDPKEIDWKDSILIGKGSFGEIRRVTWRGTPVAAKTVLPSLSKDRAVVEDFRGEVRLFVTLRHPNIVQFLGAVTKSQPLMLLTEYLPNGDLHKVLADKGALHSWEVINFALDIARGMAYLHNGPNVIIHRDLKPRNIIMDEGHQLKVGDFGLSKLIKGKNPHDFYKLTGETGSYRYMAPEVFLHEPYDKSVDVFSFGMMLYEMSEGSSPFSNVDPYYAAEAVSKGERPAFRAKGYTDDMKKLIVSCWQQLPTARPSFSSIIDTLEKLQAAEAGNHHHHHHHLWPFSSHHH